MSRAIEDYALISDCHTAALVGNDGSIDWLCLPRYDSASTFGALLGSPDHGRWLLAPTHPEASAVRSYHGDSFVLVTRWRTPTGEIEVTDVMPHGDRRADVIRRVHGISGLVELGEELVIRFGYADNLPWVRQQSNADDHYLVAIAGPDALVRRGPRLTATDHRHRGRFIVGQGETVDLSITWFPAHRDIPAPVNVTSRIEETVGLVGGLGRHLQL